MRMDYAHAAHGGYPLISMSDRFLLRHAPALAMVGLGLVIVMGSLPHALPSDEDAGTVPDGSSEAVVPDSSRASPPRGLMVPGYLQASVVPVATDADGALLVPDSPDRLGWWALGALPGATHGTVLLAGHVDSRDQGLGAFAALRDVPIGTRVQVTAADDRSYSYVINARRTYRKEALPQDLFTGAGAARLALVTCTGRYNGSTHQYEENLVLFGVPASSVLA
jgi:hypothetical protein